MSCSEHNGFLVVVLLCTNASQKFVCLSSDNESLSVTCIDIDMMEYVRDWFVFYTISKDFQL